MQDSGKLTIACTSCIVICAVMRGRRERRSRRDWDLILRDIVGGVGWR